MRFISGFSVEELAVLVKEEPYFEFNKGDRAFTIALVKEEFTYSYDQLMFLEREFFIQDRLNCLYKDFTMLMDGEWEPDYGSAECSRDSVEEVASKLNIALPELNLPEEKE